MGRHHKARSHKFILKINNISSVINMSSSETIDESFKNDEKKIKYIIELIKGNRKNENKNRNVPLPLASLSNSDDRQENNSIPDEKDNKKNESQSNSSEAIKDSYENCFPFEFPDDNDCPGDYSDDNNYFGNEESELYTFLYWIIILFSYALFILYNKK